jgi:hypothetical protein
LSLVSGGGGVSVSGFEIVKHLFGVLCIESPYHQPRVIYRE